MYKLNLIWLFILSFIGMMIVYLFILGSFKTVNIITNEYIFIILVFLLSFVPLYFKRKLEGIELIDFNVNNTISLKNTILFFLIFQVVDYYYEDGFIGMISQWFMYWIMGIMTIQILSIVNYYKNYKYFKPLLKQEK